MSNNSDVNIQALISIKDKIQVENIEEASTELENLMETLETNDAIIKHIQLLGNILIISDAADDHIHYLLRSSSRILLQQKGVDNLFKYWIMFHEQDYELYQYIIDISEKKLAEYADQIDMKSQFAENIIWFSKYNKKILNDLFESTDYSFEKLTCLIESAYRTKKFLYYKNFQQWHAINIENNTSEYNKKDAYIPLLYNIHNHEHMISVMTQHISIVMITEKIKFDRYIIIDAHTVSILLQILSFSKIDKGNYWFHFLLNAKWKKRLKNFGEIGYILPQKSIGHKNKLQDMLLFVSELQKHFREYSLFKIITELKKIYHSQYLNNLRIRRQNDLSKIRIMMITSRHSSYIQYACKTLKKGFKKIGCKSVLLREKRYQGSGFELDFIFRIIKNFKPDLILVINNFRPNWLKYFLPKIPFVTWIHDMPETLPIPCHTVADNDFIFAASNFHIEKALPRAFPVLKKHDITLLPFIRDIDINVPNNKVKKYDIGCITNLRVLPEIVSYYEHSNRNGSDMEKLIHALLKIMEKLEPFEIASILISKNKSIAVVKKALNKINIQTDIKINKNHPFVNDIFHFGIGHFLQKTLPVRHLIENGFTNFFLGGYGWDQINFFKPYAAGRINHRDLRSTSSDIAININPSAIITLHPRVGEMLEADSFFISSWKGKGDMIPITNYFTEDKEVVLFRTFKELTNKIVYFLQHPEKRETITKNAKKKFIKTLSAETGCKTILNKVLGK